MKSWLDAKFARHSIGSIAAINGEMKQMPIVGKHYQKWFGTAFD